MFKPLTNLFGFGFGAGFITAAPGTWGSLAAVPFIWGLSWFSDSIYLLVTLLSALGGIPICRAAAESLGSHDHPAIVWDEIVGMMVTMAFIPFTPASMILGFIAFRAFDILKPWPIGLLDRKVGGGTGIMLDDVAAGIFANITVTVIMRFFLDQP